MRKRKWIFAVAACTVFLGIQMNIPSVADEMITSSVSGNMQEIITGEVTIEPGEAKGESGAVSTVPDGSASEAIPAVSGGDGNGTVPAVSGGDITDAGYTNTGIRDTLTGDSTVVTVPEENEDKTGVVAVEVPRNLNFILDPYELCDKGTVWSQSYSFRNNGDTSVRLRLEDVKCILKSDVSAVSSKEVTESILDTTESILDSRDKVICLQLTMENGDVVDITEKGNYYEMVLKPGESLTFAVNGTLSRQPQTGWKSGDVTVKMIYDVQIEESIEEQ